MPGVFIEQTAMTEAETGLMGTQAEERQGCWHLPEPRRRRKDPPTEPAERVALGPLVSAGWWLELRRVGLKPPGCGPVLRWPQDDNIHTSQRSLQGVAPGCG